MYMDEFKNGVNILNVGIFVEDLLLEFDVFCELVVEVYLNVIYVILSLLVFFLVYVIGFI